MSGAGMTRARLSAARSSAVILAALLGLSTGPVRAQDPAAQDGPAAEAPAPKPRPKPKPKPKPKPAPAKPAPAPAAAPAPTDAAEPPPPAPVPAQAPTFSANLPGLTVACEGKAALYDGGKDVAVWVTRTGVITIENPLRPLTPETIRVLQVVIGGKAATAYGPDLFALRRGGSPAALEATSGGAIRWDSTATPLPDTLNIVSETGQPVAQLAFQSCGEAPAVQAAAPKAAKAGAAKGRGKAPAKAAPQAPPGIGIPRGALPEGALQ